MRRLTRLRKGTTLYHGTTAKWAKVIEQFAIPADEVEVQ